MFRLICCTSKHICSCPASKPVGTLHPATWLLIIINKILLQNHCNQMLMVTILAMRQVSSFFFILSVDFHFDFYNFKLRFNCQSLGQITHESQKWCERRHERCTIHGHVSTPCKYSVDTLKWSGFNNDVLRSSVLADELTVLASGLASSSWRRHRLPTADSTLKSHGSTCQWNNSITYLSCK